MTQYLKTPKKANGSVRSELSASAEVPSGHMLLNLFRVAGEEAAVVTAISLASFAAVLSGKSEPWCFGAALVFMLTYKILKRIG